METIDSHWKKLESIDKRKVWIWYYNLRLRVKYILG